MVNESVTVLLEANPASMAFSCLALPRLVVLALCWVIKEKLWFLWVERPEGHSVAQGEPRSADRLTDLMRVGCNMTPVPAMLLLRLVNKRRPLTGNTPALPSRFSPTQPDSTGSVGSERMEDRRRSRGPEFKNMWLTLPAYCDGFKLESCIFNFKSFMCFSKIQWGLRVYKHVYATLLEVLFWITTPGDIVLLIVLFQDARLLCRGQGSLLRSPLAPFCIKTRTVCTSHVVSPATMTHSPGQHAYLILLLFSLHVNTHTWEGGQYDIYAWRRC